MPATPRYASCLAVALASLLLAHPAAAEGPAARRAEPAAAEHERFVAIAGARNFRDAGGYRTTDGRTVRLGRLYRSGSLGDLSPAGMLALQRLGIGAIIDLRSTAERQRDRSNWLAMAQLGYWTREYGLSQGDLKSVFGDPAQLSAQSVRAMMIGAYRRLPYEQAPAYRELFARLAGGEDGGGKGAVVVNCTAGKDRTGIATALVLTALGVPYATVREDFLLSNGAPGMETLQAALSGPLAALPPDIARPLVGVEPEYLDATFEQIRQDHATVEAYLQRELGVGPPQLAALRKRLLD